LLVILPTNKKLLDPAIDPSSDTVHRLLQHWGRLHAVRSVLALASSIVLLASLMSSTPKPRREANESTGQISRSPGAVKWPQNARCVDLAPAGLAVQLGQKGGRSPGSVKREYRKLPGDGLLGRRWMQQRPSRPPRHSAYPRQLV
jgi:hypothetical protein